MVKRRQRKTRLLGIRIPRRVLSLLAAIVVFATTYALILPAITLEDVVAEEEPGIELALPPEEQEPAEDPAEDPTDAEPGAEDESEALPQPEEAEQPDDTLPQESEETPEDEIPDAPEEATPEDTEESNLSMPALRFEVQLGSVKLLAEAEEGAFPEGTALKAEPVEDLYVLYGLQPLLEDDERENRIWSLSFCDADGEEASAQNPVWLTFIAPDLAEKNGVMLADLDENLSPMEYCFVPGKTGGDQMVFLPESFPAYLIVFDDNGIPEAEESRQAEEAETKTEETPDEEAMPAVRFEQFCAGVLVIAEAEEDTFRAGTTMDVKPVYEQEVLDAIESAVEETVRKVLAFDITFYDADGNEIEPLKPIRVSISTPQIAQADNALVVHVDAEMDAQVVDQSEEETPEDQVVFQADSFSVYALVFTGELNTTVLTGEGETFAITLNFDEESGVPEDAELKVEELLPESESYQQYYDASARALELEEDGICQARFFDIEIWKDGEKIEPLTPVTVEIRYVDALELSEDQSLSMVHFAQDGVDVIRDVSLAEDGTEISYTQDSFSVTGAIVWNPQPNNKYMVLVNYQDEPYVVLNDGRLEKIEGPHDGLNFDMDSPMLWTYDGSHLYHNAEGVDYDWTLQAVDYYRRYLDPNAASGLLEEYNEDGEGNVTLTNTNPKYVGDRNAVLNETALVFSSGNGIKSANSDSYIGVVKDANGDLRIVGGVSQENAVPAWMASPDLDLTTFINNHEVPEVGPENHTVNHIDIGIYGKAELDVPLAYGTYMYKDAGGNWQTVTFNEAKDLELKNDAVDIRTDDIKRAVISAYKKVKRNGVETGEIEYLDDAFYVTGYSSNKETGLSYDQVRIEGVFKVSDMEAKTEWYNRNSDETKAERLQNRIYYTISTTKPVTFMFEDPVYGQLYDPAGEPLSITVDITFTASFDYFDERNECPPLHPGQVGGSQENEDNWKAGAILYTGTSGMDFVLGGDVETNPNIVAIEITKKIVDEDGNLLNPAEKINNRFYVYTDLDGNPNDVAVLGEENPNYQNYLPVHEKTISVGTSGMSLIYDYDVGPGMYYIAEDKSEDSLPRSFVDTGGREWNYIKTDVMTEYVWRDGPDERQWHSVSYTLEDGAYNSIPEVLGNYTTPAGAQERNGFLEYTVYNYYTAKTEFSFVKKWFGFDTEHMGTWPDDMDSIEVTLNRSFSYQLDEETVTVEGDPITLTLTRESGTDYTVAWDENLGYVFTIPDLEKYGIYGGVRGEWVYTLAETVPEDYLVRYFPNGASSYQGAEAIDNGGTVENRLVIYQLPHTGGMGTFGFTASGALLAVTAALLLALKAKRSRGRRSV